VLPDLSLALPDLLSVLPGMLPALPGAPKVLSGTLRRFQTCHITSSGSPVQVIRDPSYSEGRLECPPRVWYSPEIDASKFTLHIFSDTPGGFQWLKYILLMTGEYQWHRSEKWMYIFGLQEKSILVDFDAELIDNPPE
jgi:hypothetical protein